MGVKTRMKALYNYHKVVIFTRRDMASEESLKQMMQSENVRSILPHRYFTLEEANQALNTVRSQFEIAVIYNRRLNKIVAGMSDKSREAELKKLAAQIREDINRVLNVVRKTGVEVGNLTPGTLDFPALRNGAQVYISWRLGDGSVSWWRPMKAAKSHRKLVCSDYVCWEWRN
jgi:hypothetical protein